MVSRVVGRSTRCQAVSSGDCALTAMASTALCEPLGRHGQIGREGPLDDTFGMRLTKSEDAYGRAVDCTVCRVDPRTNARDLAEQKPCGAHEMMAMVECLCGPPCIRLLPEEHTVPRGGDGALTAVTGWALCEPWSPACAIAMQQAVQTKRGQAQ